MPRKNFADESGLKRDAWLTRRRNVGFSAKKSENVHVSPKPSVQLPDTPVYNCRTLECPVAGHQQKYITTITTTIRTVGDRRSGLKVVL